MTRHIITILILGILTLSCTEKTHLLAHTVAPASTGAIRLALRDSLEMTGGMSPRGISFGPDGALYVCDRESRNVLRLKAGEEEVLRFGGFDARNGGRFSPEDVDASGGVDVFVLDAANSRVFRLDRGLRSATVIYEGKSGDRDRFGLFRGLAYDSGSGDIFATNGAEGTVDRLDFVSGITRALGGFGDERQSLRQPGGIAVDDGGMIFIADEGRGAVAVLSRSGGGIRFVGASVLDSPRDVAILSDGLLAVADRRGVVVMNRNGIVEGVAGYGIDREIQPSSVAWRDGRLYVADSLSGAILVYVVEKHGKVHEAG